MTEIRKFISFLIALMILLSSAYCASNKILKVETKKHGEYSEVTVYTSSYVSPQIILLESPNRIAVSFPDSSIDSPVTIPGKSPLIQMVQAAQFDDNTVYVIVEPKEELSYQFTSLLGQNKYIIEFAKAKPGTKKIISPSSLVTIEAGMRYEPAAPETPEEVTTREVILPTIQGTKEYDEESITSEEAEVILFEKLTKPAPKIATKKKEPAKTPVIQKETVTKPVEPVEPPKELITVKRPEISKEAAVKPKIAKKPVKKAVKAETNYLTGKIIVIDPGHGGRDPGYISKSGYFEKYFTLKVAQRLQELLNYAGAKAYLTRDGDVNISNKDIVGYANGIKPDMFIAIHFNSYTSPWVSGVETYYFTPQSRRYALAVQKNLSRTVKKRNRGIKKEIYYTIHHTTMPAVLVEAGYLTSPREEKLILTKNYRRLIALGLYKGIKEYAKISSKWTKLE